MTRSQVSPSAKPSKEEYPPSSSAWERILRCTSFSSLSSPPLGAKETLTFVRSPVAVSPSDPLLSSRRFDRTTLGSFRVFRECKPHPVLSLRSPVLELDFVSWRFRSLSVWDVSLSLSLGA
jgi:hypothetical protein